MTRYRLTTVYASRAGEATGAVFFARKGDADKALARLLRNPDTSLRRVTLEREEGVRFRGVQSWRNPIPFDDPIPF